MYNSPYLPPSEDTGINITEHRYYISADLGQAFDYTAISVFDKTITGRGCIGYNREGEITYNLRHLERMRDVEYPVIVDRLMSIYRSEALRGSNRAVIIDFTGLGRPVFDLAKMAGFNRSLTGISITGGNDASYTNGHYNVPKRDLVSNMQIQLQNNRLKIASGINERQTLIEEMQGFQTKISENGKDTYNGRSGVHDDIVMSVAMGLWCACRSRFNRFGDDRIM